MPEAWNLDDLSTDPDDLDYMGDTLIQLATYAFLKARAMRARHEGKIETARRAEAKLERLYKKLPEWARW